MSQTPRTTTGAPPVTPTPASAPTSGRRAVLARRVRFLVAATITYNLIEAVVALAAGTAASSSALIGFGLDSVVEVASAAAVAWQFAGPVPEAREKTALRVIAYSFFALAAFVTVDALRALIGGVAAEHSTVGLVLAALSLAVMPGLSYAQRRAGRELGSASAVADSKQTLLCTYLSAVLLVGLVFNSAFGWSWADPLAALVIAAIAVREGLEAWRGDTCCAPVASALSGSAAAQSSRGEDTCCAPASNTRALPQTPVPVPLGVREPAVVEPTGGHRCSCCTPASTPPVASTTVPGPSGPAQ